MADRRPHGMTGTFIRPQVQAWFRRWRETLAAIAVASLGAWWAFASAGLLAWIGGALALGGVAVAGASFQRTRFRSHGGGVGVVQLDEGRLTYFGPLTGGSLDLRDITEVAHDPQGRPPHWVLRSPETTLAIPVDAEGAEALFDAFSQLPGLDLRAVTSVRDRPRGGVAVLWRKDGPAPSSRRLR